MKIHIYSIVHNDEYILPYFLRHYSTFADKIFIIDDHSTDRTKEISVANPKVEFLNFEYNRGMNEEDFNNCFENAYKKNSRGIADWVMCVDSDELIYHPQILDILKSQRESGVRIIKNTGYMMVSEVLPSGKGQIYEECNHGVRFPGYDKPVIFDPSLNITFGEGRHTIQDPDNTPIRRAKILLLHYRYLSKDYFIKRSLHLYDRIVLMDKKNKSDRMKRGLAWYDKALKMKLEKII